MRLELAVFRLHTFVRDHRGPWCLVTQATSPFVPLSFLLLPHFILCLSAGLGSNGLTFRWLACLLGRRLSREHGKRRWDCFISFSFIARQQFFIGYVGSWSKIFVKSFTVTLGNGTICEAGISGAYEIGWLIMERASKTLKFKWNIR